MSDEVVREVNLDIVPKPRIDFTLPFDRPLEDYPKMPIDGKWPPVTRANFMSFLINSFRVGEGKFPSQFFYIEWLGANTGQDLLQDIHNLDDQLREKGVEKVLSEEEQEYFMRELNNVDTPTHHKITKDRLRGVLRGQLNILFQDDIQKERIHEIIGQQVLVGMSESMAMNYIATLIQAYS